MEILTHPTTKSRTLQQQSANWEEIRRLQPTLPGSNSCSARHYIFIITDLRSRVDLVQYAHDQAFSYLLRYQGQCNRSNFTRTRSGRIPGKSPSSFRSYNSRINRFCGFADVKKKPYVNLCPNGRVPTIMDPNIRITLWESAAIVNYLIETYDPSHQLSYDTFPVRHQLQQWLHFQVSGQGPYYGQLGWFQRLSERVPLAIEHYTQEIRRVMGVLDRALDERQWLVGEKCTYADLCFVPCQELVPFIIGDEKLVQQLLEQHPNVGAWMDRMKARSKVQKVLREKSKAMSRAMQR